MSFTNKKTFKLFRDQPRFSSNLSNSNSNSRSSYSNTHFCDVCNKNFSRKGNLIRHYRLHQGIKPYQCEECRRSYATKSNLQSHLRVHDKPDRHGCEYCGKIFRRNGFLRKHEQRHVSTGDLKHPEYVQKAISMKEQFYKTYRNKMKRRAEKVKVELEKKFTSEFGAMEFGDESTDLNLSHPMLKTSQLKDIFFLFDLIEPQQEWNMLSPKWQCKTEPSNRDDIEIFDNF